MSKEKRTAEYLKRLLMIMIYSLLWGIAAAVVLSGIFVFMSITDPEHQKLLGYLSGFYIYLNYTLPETFKAIATYSPKTGETDAKDSDTDGVDTE